MRSILPERIGCMGRADDPATARCDDDPACGSPSPLNGERAGVRGEAVGLAFVPSWFAVRRRSSLNASAEYNANLMLDEQPFIVRMESPELKGLSSNERRVAQ